MNFKYMLLVTLFVVPCFAKVVKTVEPAITEEENVVVMTNEEANPALANEECPNVPSPMIEKVGTKCKVDHCMPSQCFKVIKHITREDLYKIPGENRHECTICDENGCRPCCGDKLSCGCAPKCAHPCNKCESRCEGRCARHHKTHCNRCTK
jgi:hypothetical protein